MKTRHHEKYREWEAQEVYIEGLTFCNLDEMETHGRKLKKKTSLMFDFYPTCLEKTKHVGIFTPGCYFPHMFGFDTYVWEKVNMREKSHTIICL